VSGPDTSSSIQPDHSLGQECYCANSLTNGGSMNLIAQKECSWVCPGSRKYIIIFADLRVSPHPDLTCDSKCTNSVEGPAGSASTRRRVIRRPQPMAQSTHLSVPSSRRCSPLSSGPRCRGRKRSTVLITLSKKEERALNSCSMLVQCRMSGSPDVVRRLFF